MNRTWVGKTWWKTSWTGFRYCVHVCGSNSTLAHQDGELCVKSDVVCECGSCGGGGGHGLCVPKRKEIVLWRKSSRCTLPQKALSKCWRVWSCPHCWGEVSCGLELEQWRSLRDIGGKIRCSTVSSCSLGLNYTSCQVRLESRNMFWRELIARR